MNRDTAYRRHQLSKRKQRATVFWNRWFPGEPADPRWVGIMASTHMCPCSCIACGNPRKYGGGAPASETRSTPEHSDIWK